MSEFFETTIGDQITLQRGFDITKNQQAPGKIPVVSSGGVSSFHNEFKVEGCGVVLGRKGTLGTVFYLKQDFWPHDTSLWVKDFKGNDPRFVYYFFLSISSLLKSMDVGAANPALNRNHVHPMRILWTSLANQKSIAHILGTLDDKIELNRQMNQTLEAMAQALFKSWFVDFDPVMDNALAAGNDIPDELQLMAEKRRVIASEAKQSHRLIETNPELASKFPSVFEYNETLGKWIPEGWEVKEIALLCKKIQNGGTPRRDNESYWMNGNIPWLASGEVRENIICSTKGFISENGLNNSSAKWVAKCSTVIAMYGATAGQVAITAMDLTTNQAVCSLIPKDGFEFFNYLNLSNQVGHLESQARGSAQQNISKGIIELSKVVVPSSNILGHFHKYMIANFEKHIDNIYQIETLSQLRDRLLPQLISGKVRVQNCHTETIE